MSFSNISGLSSAANSVISHTLSYGANMMIKRPRTEVGYVAAVVLGAVPGIAQAWKPILARAGLQIEMKGVFCHGSPMIDAQTNGSSTRCELADLLVVVDRLDTNPKTRIASLIQAKMARAAGRVQLAGRSSVKQLSLYQNWPSFTFTDTHSYGSHTYNIPVLTAAFPGWFGVIDRHLKNGLQTPPPMWTQHPPSPTPVITTNGRRLGDFVTDAVFARNAGRAVAIPPQTDWDRLVELLLHVTYTGLFTHQDTLGVNRAPRGVTELLVRSAAGNCIWPAPLAGPSGQGAPPGDAIVEMLFDPPAAGISTMSVAIDRIKD